jgi:flavin-dependent dehydrogenase
MQTDFDVLVVGARCAGAATALLLARAGARVLVIDRGVYGTDTVSTHALMRGGIMQLQRWGVLPRIERAATPAVRTTTFAYRTHQLSVAIAPRYGVDALYAPRRTVLDRALVDEATLAGAEFSYRTLFADLLRDAHDRVNGAVIVNGSGRLTIHADLVIGADGVHSTVAQHTQAPNVLTGRHKTATLYSYWQGLETQGYEWHYATRASVGAIPTNDGVCVFLSMPSEDFAGLRGMRASDAYEQTLRRLFPQFSQRLVGATRAESVRGIGGEYGFLKQTAGDGWALVGDAGYFKDPLTAHGITDALRDAELLTRAIVDGRPEAMTDFTRTQHALSQQLFDVTEQIASFDWTDDELQQLHRLFSREMTREQQALADLPPWPWQSAVAAAVAP